MGRRQSVRHHTLKVNSKHPYNAEPPCSVLANNYLTPVELFYKRNHGNIPEVEENGIDDYPITVGGLVEKLTTLTMGDVKKLPKHELIVTFQVKIVGYAISGGGRGIDRVDVSPDGGKTWVEASRHQKTGVKYISDDDENRDKWAWVFFETEIEVKEDTQIISRAVDTSTNYQPETVEPLWNVSGLMNNSWFRVNVKVQKLM